MSDKLHQAYDLAREEYAALGVDAEAALQALTAISLSLPCWPGDDVRGFEISAAPLGGGLAATGNYPGRARNADELRQDLQQALSLIPGRHRVNLHSIYGEFGDRPVERDEFAPEHFAGWIEWAKANDLKLDFNATLFSHPLASSGLTLSHPNPDVRRFWIDHVDCCRRIAAAIGHALQDDCIHNLWIPDGMKDFCVDRAGYRRRLWESLDDIFANHYVPYSHKDALEPKLFGIGSESFVVGSCEFYLTWLQHESEMSRTMLCLDTGHFHPTESVADKLSALLAGSETTELLLHISRGVRWDSDHVPVLDDSLLDLCHELVRGHRREQVHIALDFFDASINRVAAWVIGARSVLKGLLRALLEPHARLVEYEERGDYTARLALLEEIKNLPFGLVWDYHCVQHQVPPGMDWLPAVVRYEQDVLALRNS